MPERQDLRTTETLETAIQTEMTTAPLMMVYEFENRMQYLEDKVQMLLETIYDYRLLFEGLAGSSSLNRHEYYLDDDDV